MYSYKPSGLPIKKRLQTNENVAYYNVNHLLLSNSTGTLNMDATYDYDNEGKMTSVNYPTTYTLDGNNNPVPAAGPTYTYAFDEMHRPKLLTDQNSNNVVSGLTYGPANELKTVNYFGVSESRTYNSMLQMTRLTAGQVDISYTFPNALNNGKISSQKDNLSGETVTYQYDSLNRLTVATGSGWNQNFGYDGFGNLVSKTGTNSPVLSVAIDATTNRVVGQFYDYNGNQLSTSAFSGAVLTYDPENRLLTAPGVQYAYDTQNKRIWKGTLDTNGNLTGQELYFYGIDGQKLGTYSLADQYSQGHATILSENPYSTNLAVFFGAKRVAVGGVAFVPDRLGSKGKYYPYGEERNSPPLGNDQVKFATYTRDSATGLDYANQRYYANNFGRFMSPDPYKASGRASNPQSWNRFAYTHSDPVNFYDPSGNNEAAPNPGSSGPSGPCGPQWATDPSLVGPCPEEGGGGGGGGDGGGGGGDSLLEGTGPWGTDAERQKNVTLLQSLEAAAIAAIKASLTVPRYVAYLVLRKDCINLHNETTGRESRDRTYEAWDQFGDPIDATIAERVLNPSGGLVTISSTPDGIFRDQLGPSLYNNSTYMVYQYFVTSYGGYWNNVPTYVVSPFGGNMVFSITMSTKFFNGIRRVDVSINGDAGMWNPDGTPRLYLCDTLP